MRRTELGMAVCAVVVACGPSPPAPPPVAAPEPCLAVRAVGDLPDTLVVVLNGRIDPARAPTPYNDAERTLFRLLYQSLVRVDCTGEPRPGLAGTWRGEDDDRRWTFVLADGARLWSGNAVTGAAVVSSWSRAGPPVGWDSVSAPGATELRLVFLGSRPDGARVVGDPRLAVAIPSSDSRWPMGTGPYRVDPASAAGTVVASPVEGVAGPVLLFRALRDADARDQLDRGADLVLTDRRAVLSYAAARPGYTVVPLPWSRTYVMRLTGWEWPGDPATFRASLARDAVRVEARGAEPPFWWREAGACTAAGTPARPASAPRPRLVYPADDPVARALAERLVALIREANVAAVGLGPDAFDAAIRRGDDLGAVLGVPRLGWTGCAATGGLPAGDIEPLIDTRNSLVVRTGVGPVEVDWDGIPWLGGLAR